MRGIIASSYGRHWLGIFFGLTLLLAIPQSAAEAELVVAAAKSKVYHTRPDRCAAARNIDPDNRITFESAQEAEDEARRICKFCAKIDAKQGDAAKPSKSDPNNGPPQRSKPKQKQAKHAPDQPGLPVTSPDAPQATTTRRTVTRSQVVRNVLPGGTIVLDDGERIRLAGVGCPFNGQVFCEDSTSFLLTRLKGRKVRLEWQLDEEDRPQRDLLGRIPAYVQIGTDEPDPAATMLADGLAWVERQANCVRKGVYLSREDDAAWAQRGIWKRLEGAAGRVEVTVGKHTYIYHAPDCPHVMHLTEPVNVTLNEAKGRRLAPCELWRDGKTKS